MARYIDADKLAKELRDYYGCSVECDKDCLITECAEGRIILNAPTADVAPRAEVAREIFEEIRNIFNRHYYACYQNEDGDECDAVTSYLSYVAVDFDRLEQKYTGAEPEPPKGE